MKLAVMTAAERRLLGVAHKRVLILGARHREVMDLRPVGFYESGLVEFFRYLVSGAWL